MGIYIWLNNAFKKMNKIVFPLNGNIKEIGRVYTFINGERVLLHPDSGTLVYEQTAPGIYTYNILPGLYNIEVAGAGGQAGSYYDNPSGLDPYGGNGELVTQTVEIQNPIQLQITVAGYYNGSGTFGSVYGGDGQEIKQGSLLIGWGGDGGGQSRVLEPTTSINITANGGGGSVGFGPGGQVATGGQGSGGAAAGTSSSNPNGQNAGNGQGGAGMHDGDKVQDTHGWVKIYLIG